MSNQNQNSNKSSSSSEVQNQQSQSTSNGGAQNQSQVQTVAVANGSNGVENTSTQGSVASPVTTGSQQSHSSIYDKLGIDLTDDDFAKKVADFFKFQAKPRPQPWSPNQPSPRNDNDETSEAEAKEVKEVEKRAVQAETKVKLLEAGITTDYVDDALILVNAKLGDDAKAEDVIGGLKEKFPSWFASSSKDSKQIRGTGTSFQASQPGASSGSNASEASIGRRLAASKRQSKSKFSYFGNK